MYCGEQFLQEYMMYNIPHKNVEKKRRRNEKVGIIINSNRGPNRKRKHLNIKINYMTIYGIAEMQIYVSIYIWALPRIARKI